MSKSNASGRIVSVLGLGLLVALKGVGAGNLVVVEICQDAAVVFSDRGIVYANTVHCPTTIVSDKQKTQTSYILRLTLML